MVLAVFLTWLVWTVRSALRQRAVAAAAEATELSAGKSLLLGILGLMPGSLPVGRFRFLSGGVRLNDCSGES